MEQSAYYLRNIQEGDCFFLSSSHTPRVGSACQTAGNGIDCMPRNEGASTQLKLVSHFP